MKNEKPEKVLIVEDELCLKTVLTQILSKLDSGCEVIWVESVGSAKVALRMERFSLIISDYLLKGKKTGLDLWHECERRYPDTPFLMISGIDVPSFLRRNKGARVPSFLPKPFYAEECRSMIRNLVKVEKRES
jgi:DNA-binding NtrC family response regulator